MITDALTLAGGVVGFFWGLYVYRGQKHRDHELAAKQIEATLASERLKRFENFQRMQQRYREDKAITNVLRWLYPTFDTRPPINASTNDKLTFMGFYEELALMIQSRLMEDNLAYWTMGVDAVSFYDKEQAFHDEPTWKLFNSFAQKAKASLEKLKKSPGAVDALSF